MRLRDFINIVEGVAYQDVEFNILENPTAQQIKAIRSKTKVADGGVRAILTGKSLFVWNGYYMTHHEGCPSARLGH